MDHPVDPRWQRFMESHHVPRKSDGTRYTFEERDIIKHQLEYDGQTAGPTDVEVKTISDMKIRVYIPRITGLCPCFIHIHGGGFTYLSVDAFDPFHSKVCKSANCIVISPDYTVTRTDKDISTKFPKGVEECYACFLWTVEHCSIYSIDPNRIYIGGGSSGANFATVICMMARDNNLKVRPAGQILFSPFLNPRCDTPSWFKYGRGGYHSTIDGALVVWKNYMRSPQDELNPYCCPLKSQNLSNLPKALILQGELDPVVDEGIIYGQALKKSGVDVVINICADMPHVYVHLDAIFPLECNMALGQLVAFINS